MNLATLRTRCKTRFRDANNDILQDSDWNAYINDVYDDVINDSPWWPFFKATNRNVTYPAQAASINLATALGTDVWRVNEILDLTDRYPLAPLHGGNMVYGAYPYADQQFGSPIHYRVYGQTLEVYPRPLSAVTLSIEYMAPPPDLVADGDVPVFPEQYHRVLVFGALALAYEDDGNIPQAQAHTKRAEDILEDMKTDLLSTQFENYPMIVDVWEWQ